MLSPILRLSACSALLFAALACPALGAAAEEKARYTILFLVLDAQGELKEGIKLDPDRPTCIVVHGFTGWSTPGDSESLKDHAKAWRSRYAEVQPNVVVVKWDSPAPNLPAVLRIPEHYRRQVALSPEIGARIAAWMKENKIQPAKTLLSGHSLGAHIAAFASNQCLKTLGGPVHAIVATDPSGPLFFGIAPEQRLDKTDAPNVIVVHTTEILGYPAPLGTVDLWVLFRTGDGGAPPELDFIERHGLARVVVTKALRDPKTAGVPFLARELEFSFQAGEPVAQVSDKDQPRPSP